MLRYYVVYFVIIYNVFILAFLNDRKLFVICLFYLHCEPKKTSPFLFFK
jgi:hypothetical protein